MGKAKSPSTSLYPVTYTNLEVSPQNFLTFSFNTFATLAIPSASPKLLKYNLSHVTKLEPRLLKQPLKTKKKRIRNYVLKFNL